MSNQLEPLILVTLIINTPDSKCHYTECFIMIWTVKVLLSTLVEIKIIENCLKDSLIKLATSIEVSKTFSTDFSGTTLAAALIHGNHLLTCHLGDSRVIMISKIDSYYDSDMTA